MTPPNPEIRHGGNAAEAARALGLPACPPVKCDFSVNLNPLGPPRALRRILAGLETTATAYPEAYAESAGRALAAAHGLAEEQVVVGNGSTEIFGWILRALRPCRVGRLDPCYGGYAEVCAAYDVPMERVGVLRAARGFRLETPPELPSGVDLLFVASPNNPTGRLVPPGVLRTLARRNPDVVLVVDASFLDFARPPGAGPFGAGELPGNAVVVKSLTKFFHIAGLRLGMAWGSPEIIARIRRARLPWSVNGPAQALAPRLYADAEYVKSSRVRTRELRRDFSRRLRRIDAVTLFPSDANFLLVRLPESWPAARLQKALLRRGFLIRSCEPFEGLGRRYIRLAVRSRRDGEALAATLDALFSGKDETVRPRASATPGR